MPALTAGGENPRTESVKLSGGSESDKRQEDNADSRVLAKHSAACKEEFEKISGANLLDHGLPRNEVPVKLTALARFYSPIQ
jgi:hypothetical protein